MISKNESDASIANSSTLVHPTSASVQSRRRIVREEAEQQFGHQEWIDKSRHELAAYEYLCHVAEARAWLQLCTGSDLPEVGKELDESLRNGVVLAKLSLFFAPTIKQKIYDAGQQESLCYRHTDNINLFYTASKSVGLPDLFLFTTPDLYDLKNVLRVIYCLHALSFFLYVKGLAPRMPMLFGQVDFSEDVLRAAEEFLKGHHGTLPSFRNIGHAMSKELSPEELKRMRELELERQGREQENYLVTVQAHVRSYLARHRDPPTPLEALLRAIMEGRGLYALRQPNPPLSLVRLFLYILGDAQSSAEDMTDVLHLLQLKEQCIRLIRDNNEDDKTVHSLDTKIGLLIKNRISLSDLYSQTRTLFDVFTFRRQNRHGQTGAHAAAKDPQQALAQRKKMALYANMFHLLQTEPKYLSGLFVQLKAAQLPTFLQNVVMSLFGYAQNAREEYLLLKLFQYCIAEECRRLLRPDDMLIEYPVFLKLVVHYTRRHTEKEFLSKLLSPLVKDILQPAPGGEGNDLSVAMATVDLDMDPVSLYRKVIRDEEMSTGYQTTLPYDVSAEDALKVKAVQLAMSTNATRLCALAHRFIDDFQALVQEMPYGIRFIAQEMRNELVKAFPTMERDKLCRMTGHLIYYRYINPALIAPDTYDVIDHVTIQSHQRKNLAELARLLQLASSMTWDAATVGTFPASMRATVMTLQERLFAVYDQMLTVDSLEDHFQVSAAEMLSTTTADILETSKPVIFISPNEIYATHALLLEYVDHIVPDDVKMRHLLAELGEPPLQQQPHAGTDDSHDGLLSLYLVSPYTTEEEEKAQAMAHLFFETRMLLTPYVASTELSSVAADGATLDNVLSQARTAREEQRFGQYKAEFRRVFAAGNQTEEEEDGKLAVLYEWTQMEMRALGERIQGNLAVLAHNNRVFVSDHYQKVVNAMAQDILHKSTLRAQRRQEMKQLTMTLNKLTVKRDYLGRQIDEYNAYLKSCMAQSSSKKSSGSKKAGGSKESSNNNNMVTATKEHPHSHHSVKTEEKKYTAAELFKRGVLVGLEGVPESQRDQVVLTLTTSEVPGEFDVSAKFMGMNVDKVQIHLNELLQMQYDNVNVMTLFDVCQVNVNLLLHLLNSKFLAK